LGRKKKAQAPAARTASPPTTPPAIGPAEEFDLDGGAVAVGALEVAVGVALEVEVVAAKLVLL
jgi:hypothetical protein